MVIDSLYMPSNISCDRWMAPDGFCFYPEKLSQLRNCSMESYREIHIPKLKNKTHKQKKTILFNTQKFFNNLIFAKIYEKMDTPLNPSVRIACSGWVLTADFCFYTVLDT